MFDQKQLDWLLKTLGGLEEPLGVCYTDQQPTTGYGPRTGEDTKHDCLMKFIRLARTRHSSGWISKNQTGCPGSGVYAGFLLPPPDVVAQHVTTGLPGREGEHYLPEPASMYRFFTALNLSPPPADYCVFKPLSLFSEEEEILSVIFFVRGETLTGLVQLAYFSLDDHEAVVFPFGSGCASLLAWPFHYGKHGLDKAVVGGSDPSCRKYMGVDELSVAIPAATFRKMLAAAPESFLKGRTWTEVLKKIDKSRRVWAGQK